MIQGIGEPKKVGKMHVTMLCISAGAYEIDEIERRLQRAGDKFSDLTGKGPFLCNFKGLDQ